MTVKIDLETTEGLQRTLEGLLTAQSDTQAALAKLAGPGLTAEAALDGSGVAAFRAKDGKLRLTDSIRREKLEHEGETYVVEATVPGLFSDGAEGSLAPATRARWASSTPASSLASARFRRRCSAACSTPPRAPPRPCGRS